MPCGWHQSRCHGGEFPPGTDCQRPGRHWRPTLWAVSGGPGRLGSWKDPLNRLARSLGLRFPLVSGQSRLFGNPIVTRLVPQRVARWVRQIMCQPPCAWNRSGNGASAFPQIGSSSPCRGARSQAARKVLFDLLNFVVFDSVQFVDDRVNLSVQLLDRPAEKVHLVRIPSARL